MSKTIKEIIEINKKYEKEKEKINEIYKETIALNDLLDLQEVKDNLNYQETKELYSLIISNSSNEDICRKLKQIIEEKKLEEHPELLGVHFYPELNELEGIVEQNTLNKLDKILTKAYKSIRFVFEDYNEAYDTSILSFLEGKNIIQTQFEFFCSCNEDVCFKYYYPKTEIDKYIKYWEKVEMNQETSDDEDNELQFGCFQASCSSGCDLQICCLESFKKHLKGIKYSIVKKPDMTLENL